MGVHQRLKRVFEARENGQAGDARPEDVSANHVRSDAEVIHPRGVLDPDAPTDVCRGPDRSAPVGEHGSGIERGIPGGDLGAQVKTLGEADQVRGSQVCKAHREAVGQCAAARISGRKAVGRRSSKSKLGDQLDVLAQVIPDSELEVGLRVGVAVAAAKRHHRTDVRLGEQAPAHPELNPFGGYGCDGQAGNQREQKREPHQLSSPPAGLKTQGKFTVTSPPPWGSGNLHLRMRASMHCSVLELSSEVSATLASETDPEPSMVKSTATLPNSDGFFCNSIS